jgi:hypothetical protein
MVDPVPGGRYDTCGGHAKMTVNAGVFSETAARFRQTTVNHRFFSQFAAAFNTNVVSRQRCAVPALSTKDG